MCFIKNIGFCKLKDIGEFQNGSFIPEALYTDKAKRAYIRIKELSLSEPINLQESVFIKDEFSATNETIVREGDFVIATIGSIGKTNLITKELDGSFISNNTIRFRLFDNINLEFMEILLRSVFIQEQIQREATQTIQAKISKDSLQNILIPIIDSNIQQQISSYIKESFTLRQKSKDLLKEAVEKVEKAIAKGEY